MASGTKHAVIVSHPSPDSFNLSVARRYADVARSLGDEVVFRDLYRLNFDPVLKAGEQPGSEEPTLAEDVKVELAALSGTDVFVLVYPIWFGGPPAILKGYVDRVLGAGITHSEVHDRRPNALTGGKRLVSFTSSGNSRYWFEEQGAWMSLRNIFDTYLTHAFGLADNDHFHFDRVTKSMKEGALDAYLREVEDAARATCARFVAGRPALEYPLRD
jgi:NAD(P)H dehydrogenase (quinone)